MKTKARILTLVMMLAMLLSTTLFSISSSASEGKWEKATSIKLGDTITLVCEAANMEISSISTTSTKYGIGVAYTGSPVGTMTFEVVAGSSEDTYAFKNGNNYLCWKSGNSLNVSNKLDVNSSWKVVFSNGNAVIKNAKDESRKIQWNVSSLRFACYTSLQTDIQIYKWVELGCSHSNTKTTTEDAACTKDGYTIVICDDCHTTLSTTEIPATGHNYVNGVCAACNHTIGPVIIKQPESVEVPIGQKFSISVEVEGDGLTYQWYYKNSGSKNFAVSSFKGESYAMTMASYCHGRQVYCVITDQRGNSVTTETVTISRPPIELRIVAQPKNVEVEIGGKVQITVEAEGDGLAYQWYYKNSGSKNFAVSSFKGKAYSLTMASYCHGRQVYCVITDQYGNSVTTETVTITRPPVALTIVTQPKDVQVEIGDKVRIAVEAIGDGLTYQWYYKDMGNKDFKISSYKGSSYSINMVSYCHGRQVYCVITDQYGNQVTTEIATMTHPPMELMMLTQPTDVSVVVGEKFRVSFSVQGDGLTYQWYYKDKGGKAFKVSSNKTSAYAYSMANYMDGREVYCVITDQYGNQVTTKAVKITIEQ